MNKFLRAVVLSALAACSPRAVAEMESWYTYWGIGLAEHSYPGDLDRAFREAEAYPGVSRSEMSIDAFGFYWPLASKKTILGFVVNGSADALESAYDSVQLNQYLYALSAMRFAGEEPGQGFFMRADVGIARAVLDTSFGDFELDSGYGALVAAGYGIPISEQTRLLLSAHYRHSEIEDETFSTLGFSVAGLW